MIVHPARGTRTAIYTRFASQDGAAQNIDHQEVLCQHYAAEQGLVVVGTYADVGCSGVTLVGRQRLETMMELAIDAKLDLVLVTKLDRISRSASGLYNILDWFKHMGVRVCDVEHGMVTDWELLLRERFLTKAIEETSASTGRGQAAKPGKAGKFEATVAIAESSPNRLPDAGARSDIRGAY
jgi:predicted site-specific integrase-resolvase